MLVLLVPSWGCDVGESPAAGHVLLVEPVVVHRERRAGLYGAAAGNSVFVEKGDDGVLSAPSPGYGRCPSSIRTGTCSVNGACGATARRIWSAKAVRWSGGGSC